MKETKNAHISTSWLGLRIALAYALIGGLWIIFSDFAVKSIFGQTEARFWVELLKGLVFVGFSTLLIFVLTSRTISFIRKSEEALSRSQEVYRAVVEGTSDAIFMVDGDRNIISVNRALLDLFGYSRDELVGKSIRLLHPSDQSYADFGRVAYPAIKETPLRIEWDFRKKDGTIFPVEGTYSVVFGPNGSASGHVGIIRDITERRKAEKELREHREHLRELVRERTRELEEAQKALVQREKLKTLGAIAAEVAHEIRNPLVSIGGFSRRLHEKNPDLQEAKIILQESERLERILARLDEYLRPVDIEPRECHVNGILSESIDLLRPELENEKVRVSLDFHPSLPSAHVDPAVLTKVFLAMIRNAVRMMNRDREREIALRTYFGEHGVYVEMTTPAAPHKADDPELMLLPFESQVKGAGISTAFKLLKGMGGALSFSRYDGKAVYTVSLVKCGRGDQLAKSE